MKITLRQLTYFRALAKHRNFGRAAGACNVSQPALSVQIKELESNLGGTLVERHARDLVLTPFGRQVLDHAVAILERVEHLEQAARWRPGLAGKLVLGIIPTIAPYLLPATLAALRSRDISLDVHVLEGKTDRLIEMLKSGQVDAAVMALPADADGLNALPLFEDRFLLAGTPGRLEVFDKAAETLRPAALETHQLMLLEDGHCLTDQALEVCGRGRGHSQIEMGASSLPTLTRLVEAGFGITLIPELAAKVELAATPGIELRRFTSPEPARQIGLVRRSGSVDDGWFSQLAAILTEVGQTIVSETRQSQTD